jgi:hypothetical protein
MTETVRLSELDALVAHLTVDAYGDEEQLSGFLVGAEEGWSAGSVRGSSASKSRSSTSMLNLTRARVSWVASDATARPTRSRLPTLPSVPPASLGS